jgi:hypothetical protein
MRSWWRCDCTETCRSCSNVNFSIVFKTTDWCISWWINKTLIKRCTVFVLWKLNSDSTEDLFCSQFPVYQSNRPQNWPVTIFLTKIISFSGMFAKQLQKAAVAAWCLSVCRSTQRKFCTETNIVECLCHWDSIATLQDSTPVSCKTFRSPPKRPLTSM